MPAPKPEKPPESLLLAIELLRRIPRKGRKSAPELQRELENAGFKRELRSIQRQLDTLCQHFDIERDDRGKPYGYRWKERAQGLSIPNLSTQESLLLLLAERHLRPLLPPRLMKSMESFFLQARTRLGDDTAPLDRQWPHKVRVVAESQPLLPPKIADDVFEEVSEALYANRWLQVEYRNSADKQISAEVMPLGLAQQGPRLYLVCRFRDFDDERLLALHRFQSARATTLGFERPAGFDLERYENDGHFGFGNGQRVKLGFRITRNAGHHLLETPLSADQVVKPYREDQLHVTATVVDSGMLDWWLRSFGDSISHVRKQRITSLSTPSVKPA